MRRNPNSNTFVRTMGIALLLCLVFFIPQVDAAVIKKQEEPSSSPQIVSRMSRGVQNFSALVADGYVDMAQEAVGVGRRIAQFMPWNQARSTALADRPPIIQPSTAITQQVDQHVSQESDDIEQDESESEDELSETDNQAKTIIVSKEVIQTHPTYVTNLYEEGLGQEEVQALVDDMIEKALSIALADDNKPDPAEFLNGLIARGTVDFSGAQVKGLNFQEKVQPILVRSDSGNYRPNIVVAGNYGGVSGDFSVGDNLSVKKTLSVIGAATFESGATFGSGTNDSTTFNVGSLKLINDTNLNIKDNSQAAFQIEGGLFHVDSANTRVGINSSTPSNTLDVGGSLYISGNTTLGDSTSDTLTFTGLLASDFIPSTNNSRDLGSHTASFADIFASGTIYANALTVIGSTTQSGDITFDANNSYDIGSHTAAVKDIYASGTIYLGTSLLSSTNNTTDLGGYDNAFNDIFASGTAYLAALNANGNVTIGDTTSDTLTINGRLGSDVIPSTNNSFDLGTESLAFGELYASGTARLGWDSTTTTSILWIDATNDVVSVASSSVGNHGFVVGNGYEVYLADNVTVGDTSADNLLVNSTAAFYSNVISGVNNSSNLGTPAQSFADVYASGTLHLGNFGGPNIPIMIINSSTGNVGIASTSVDTTYSFAVGNQADSYFGGDVIIGDGQDDSITINSAWQSSLIPGQNNSISLGSQTFSLANIYASGSLHVARDSTSGSPVFMVDSVSEIVTIASSTTDYGFVVGNDYAVYLADSVTIGDTETDTLQINASTTFKDDVQFGQAIDSIVTFKGDEINYISTESFIDETFNAPLHMNLASNRIDALNIANSQLVVDTSNQLVGVSSSTLSSRPDSNVKLEVGGEIYSQGLIISGGTGNAVIYDGNGTVQSTPTNSESVFNGAFTILSVGEVDQARAFRIATSTSEGGNLGQIFEIDYDLENAALATTSFYSFVKDIPGATAFNFSTENTITSSTNNILDRTLFTVSNVDTPVFHIGAGGNVYAAESFIANSNDFGIADLAEYVDLSPGQSVVSGDAIMPDPKNPGKFKKVEEAYSSSVAGIISNTAAFAMGARGENRAALGLAGLVYTHVSDENGAIEVGDMLVTASEPGYLMKYDPAQAAGVNAVIVATALEPHTQGLGTIKTLVRASTFVGGGSGLTIVESSDGTLQDEVAFDMKNQGVVNVAYIRGMNDTWEVSSEGTLSVREVKAEQYTVVKNKDNLFASIGTGVIFQGDSSATVPSAVVNEHSRIFITFRTTLNGRTYHVGHITKGESFEVRVTYPTEEDLFFDYWIVNVEGEDEVIPNVGPTPTQQQTAGGLSVEQDIQEALEEFEEQQVVETTELQDAAEDESSNTETTQSNEETETIPEVEDDLQSNNEQDVPEEESNDEQPVDSGDTQQESESESVETEQEQQQQPEVVEDQSVGVAETQEAPPEETTEEEQVTQEPEQAEQE